jgi:alkylhydroperoxidase/carboxymuconolactone decarboxylase family protein YurZ
MTTQDFNIAIYMKEEILSQRMLLLCGCASLEAKGDLQRLDLAIREALAGGVSVNELKDAFAQLYAYTGFPRSLNALSTLERVLSERNGWCRSTI